TLYGVTKRVTQVTKPVTHEESLTLPFSIPKGLRYQSPGLRVSELPWVMKVGALNPNGVLPHTLKGVVHEQSHQTVSDRIARAAQGQRIGRKKSEDEDEDDSQSYTALGTYRRGRGTIKVDYQPLP